MRLGINSLFLVPGDVGGTEVYFRKNVKEMVSRFSEHEFVIFTNRENDQLLQSELADFTNVEYLLIRINAANRIIRIIAEQTILPLAVRSAKLDLMWSPGYTAALICPCPQIVTIHDLQYLSYPEDMSWLERITLDFLVRSACRRCKHIIAVSQFSKEEIVRNRFASREKISVVYEGVEKVFRPNTSKHVPDDMHHPDRPYILCVAHTYPHKQVHLLVESYAKIQNEIPHHLVLVGKPRRGEPDVEKALRLIPDESRIHRYSELEFARLVELFQMADIFVLPSVYEGFGLPILEALMAELPVITTKEASLPEVGGECVTYVDEISSSEFAAAIMKIISLTESEREDFRRRAAQWVENFTWEESADGTMNVLVKHARN